MNLKLISNILYLLATGFLLTASILTFNKKNLPSYLYLIGTSLFFIKSIITFIIYKKNTNNIYQPYSGIL